jgi:hypothetical protein
LGERDKKVGLSLDRLRAQLETTASWLINERGEFDDRVPVQAGTLEDFDTLASAVRKGGDPETTASISLTRLLLQDLEGRSVAEIRAKLSSARSKK